MRETDSNKHMRKSVPCTDNAMRSGNKKGNQAVSTETVGRAGKQKTKHFNKHYWMSTSLEKANNVSGANSRLAWQKRVVNETGNHEVRGEQSSDHIMWLCRTQPQTGFCGYKEYAPVVMHNLIYNRLYFVNVSGYCKSREEVKFVIISAGGGGLCFVSVR